MGLHTSPIVVIVAGPWAYGRSPCRRIQHAQLDDRRRVYRTSVGYCMTYKVNHMNKTLVIEVTYRLHRTYVLVSVLGEPSARILWVGAEVVHRMP